MDSQKASRPNGLPALFYKKYWNIVGDSVVKAIINFFESGKILNELNSTLTVLIPRIQNTTSDSQYRPSSLCNVVYKTIANLLVTRLREILPKLISPCQSAFIPGRWIAENKVILHETLHIFKKRKVKDSMMAEKLDLQKAYDRVNWKFLKTVLDKFGFNNTFSKWILECVSSISSTLLIKNSPYKWGVGVWLVLTPREEGLDKGIPYPHISSFYVKMCWPE